ncbi:hypothetical protein EB796_020334 [Bugula neritina]|uniref:Uncharacterized protein n=1 Tax=Bugula neritina TaxID=10212 RepID=A0A7J7J634_BUGNE|nr:hypothetical protein EB796_020334 [Bugula neritina]
MKVAVCVLLCILAVNMTSATLEKPPKESFQEIPVGLVKRSSDTLVKKDLFDTYVNHLVPAGRLKFRNKRQVTAECLKMCVFCFNSGEHSSMRGCMVSCSDETLENITCPSYANRQS